MWLNRQREVDQSLCHASMGESHRQHTIWSYSSLCKQVKQTASGCMLHRPYWAFVLLYRCNSTQFNPHGQLFFNPLVQSMRMIVHFGETLPEQITPEHIISSSLLLLWALAIFFGMLFCFGIGAATGDQLVVSTGLSSTVLHGVEQAMWTCVYECKHSFTCTIICTLELSIRCFV